MVNIFYSSSLPFGVSYNLPLFPDFYLFWPHSHVCITLPTLIQWSISKKIWWKPISTNPPENTVLIIFLHSLHQLSRILVCVAFHKHRLVHEWNFKSWRKGRNPIVPTKQGSVANCTHVILRQNCIKYAPRKEVSMLALYCQRNVSGGWNSSFVTCSVRVNLCEAADRKQRGILTSENTFGLRMG